MNDTSVVQQPLVSVCIPTYNRAQRMKRAVEALLQGEYRNLEILVSDNGSGDDTRGVGEALALAHSQVRYFRHPENMGPIPNFEFVRQQARGKYFLWHGDDDYLDPGYIRACVEALERDPSLVLASGLAAYHYLGAHDISHYGNVIQPGSESPLLRIASYLWRVRENSMFCGVYRVDRVKDGQMPNLLAGDWMWMADVLLHGRALVIPAVHVHRDYGDSTSDNIARIVRVQGLPAWNARFPWAAIVFSFMPYLWMAMRRAGYPVPRALAISLAAEAVLVARAIAAYQKVTLGKVPLLRRLSRAIKARRAS